MEMNFKRVHTGKDLAISAAVLLAGAGLFFANRGLGIFIAAVGILLLIFYKGGYRNNGRGAVLTKKSEDLCKACKPSIVDFLEGKDANLLIRRGNEGGSVRLDVYYNRADSVAYAQLYEFRNYTYEPVTNVVRLSGEMAGRLIASIL